jgi:hypothetical protein
MQACAMEGNQAQHEGCTVDDRVAVRGEMRDKGKEVIEDLVGNGKVFRIF